MDTKPQKMPKVAKVKNKAPAEIQITAEQLLREAKERDLEILPPPPKQKISDPEELADYQHRKRKAFEDGIRKNRTVISNWIKYALWEESQKEVQRARSIFERALDVDHRNITLWLKYTEMEMRNRQVNHARNLWDRAVTILPRANQFWYKYTYMEEMLGNIAGARQVFDRWMEWEPDEQAWQTYIKFELRRVYERANASLRGAGEKEERAMLLEAWRDFEARLGDEEARRAVANRMPRRVKRRQRVQADDGSEEGWEEFFDYIFPEDEATKPNLKLLEMAKAWKKKQVEHKDVEEKDEGEDEGSPVINAAGS